MSVVASDRSDRASSGYLSIHRTPTGARSPTSSICSFAGSVNSETVIAHNKYLMKTLCLAKKSTSMPDKTEYANLLTAGLGARKWIASLDFDADSFKAAIVNIYPRLASVPSYTLWNVKSDKTFEKLPSTVNTPKRIKAYLGPTFTGSLVIMPSEEISLGPVKIPHHMSRSDFQARTSSSSSSRSRDRVPHVPKEEKSESSSGYESGLYQDSNAIKKARQNESQNYYSREHGGSSSSHKLSHAISSTGRLHRQICVTCGRLAKQVGSSGFYDIHNSTTFATADGYMSIAKKVKEMFHLELPRSKILQSEQICRKCFRAMNEIHFLESQLKRSKEEMMTNLFSTMSKINKLEHITREAASSSSDSSTSSLGSLMTAAAMNPWIQEAKYLIEQRATAMATEPGPANPRPEDPARRSPTKSAQPMAAIFSSHNDARNPRNFVDYSSPQPVFLAPLASFAQQPHGRPRSQSPDSGHRQMAPVLPLNMSMLRSPPGGQREQASPVYPTTSQTAIFLGKPTPFFTQAASKPQSNREEIEERMAAEEEADAKDAANREHAAYIEEALRQHSEAKAASSNNSSRSSSIMGNYTRNQSLSPDSNSPSPPTVNPNPDQVGEPDKDAGSTSNNDSRRPWKKRYHEVPSPPQDQPENLEKKRVRVMTKAEKREYQNVEHFGTMDSSSTGPKSSSSGGSPPDHEDLGSDYSVSPNSEKVDQVNSTEN